MRKGKARRIEVMDTTLRDGEQAEGISMMPEEKRTIAQRLLETVKVDRIEVASARVSEGERRAVKAIVDYADSKGWTDRIEILGFVDGNQSVDWAKSVGARVINLLTKGSLHHCREQLRKTHAQHIDDIRRTIEYGAKNGITFNVYLEDWSGGMIGSIDYVDEHIEALRGMPVRRIMLPDTLGLLSPPQVREFVGRIVSTFPDRHFDFHGHNDYGLGTANTLEAAIAGAHGVHVTVNGMGERAGNVTLDEVVVALRDHAGVTTRVDERALSEVSRLVEVFSGRRVPANKPIVGENVFTQTAGIHADGDMKGNLYESRLTPARFGQHRTYAMGKLMGKASLDFNLQRLNITLSPEQKQQLVARIVELGDQKKSVTQSDLPFLISEVLQTRDLRVFEVKDYLSREQSRVAPYGDASRALPRQGISRDRFRRRRVRCLHAGAQEHRAAARLRAAEAARLRGENSTRRQDRRPRGNHDQVGGRHEDPWRAQRSAGRGDSGHGTRAEYDRATDAFAPGAKGKGQGALLPLAPHPLPLSKRGLMAQLGTKKSLTLAAAKEIGNAAEAKARELNFTNSIAVIDDGGNVIYQVTMDGTQTGSINVAVQKALAALRFKRSTKLFQDMVTGDKPHMAFLPGAVPVEGGLPLFVDGQIYGAIGVSGMPSDKDGIVAQAGADLAATLR